MTPRVTVREGDCLDVLRTLDAESVQCCVTSPPYFGLRDYGHAGQIGLESTPDEYVANLVEVFREVRRVLRDDGTLWLNLGDSYANDAKWGGRTSGKHASALHGAGEEVHHINGQRADNRLENLCLFSSGAAHQRAEGSMKRVVRDLLDQGRVVFDRERGEYRLV